MESLSRSSHRRKHSTTAANVFSSSFSFKNPYGDVLLSNGGERKSLQAHEYSEIFSGSSSIPVLDLSGMDERVGSGDSRSSKLDYTNIFGGLTHDEVFVPYEELLEGSAKKAKTRIPAEGRPYLQESGSRHPSTKMEKPFGVASEQSVDGVKLQESDSRHPSRKTEKPSGVASDQSVDGVEQQHMTQLKQRTLELQQHEEELKQEQAQMKLYTETTFSNRKEFEAAVNSEPKIPSWRAKVKNQILLLLNLPPSIKKI